MPDMLVRDLSSSTLEELKRRAEAAGVSLQVYVVRLLHEHTAKPTVEQWLRRLDELPKVHATTTGAAAVSAARDERA